MNRLVPANNTPRRARSVEYVTTRILQAGVTAAEAARDAQQDGFLSPYLSLSDASEDFVQRCRALLWGDETLGIEPDAATRYFVDGPGTDLQNPFPAVDAADLRAAEVGDKEILCLWLRCMRTKLTAAGVQSQGLDGKGEALVIFAVARNLMLSQRAGPVGGLFAEPLRGNSEKNRGRLDTLLDVLVYKAESAADAVAQGLQMATSLQEIQRGSPFQADRDSAIGQASHSHARIRAVLDDVDIIVALVRALRPEADRMFRAQAESYVARAKPFPFFLDIPLDVQRRVLMLLVRRERRHVLPFVSQHFRTLVRTGLGQYPVALAFQKITAQRLGDASMFGEGGAPTTSGDITPQDPSDPVDCAVEWNDTSSAWVEEPRPITQQSWVVENDTAWGTASRRSNMDFACVLEGHQRGAASSGRWVSFNRISGKVGRASHVISLGSATRQNLPLCAAVTNPGGPEAQLSQGKSSVDSDTNALVVWLNKCSPNPIDASEAARQKGADGMPSSASNDEDSNGTVTDEDSNGTVGVTEAMERPSTGKSGFSSWPLPDAPFEWQSTTLGHQGDPSIYHSRLDTSSGADVNLRFNPGTWNGTLLRVVGCDKQHLYGVYTGCTSKKHEKAAGSGLSLERVSLYAATDHPDIPPRVGFTGSLPLWECLSEKPSVVQGAPNVTCKAESRFLNHSPGYGLRETFHAEKNLSSLDIADPDDISIWSLGHSNRVAIQARPSDTSVLPQLLVWGEIDPYIARLAVLEPDLRRGIGEPAELISAFVGTDANPDRRQFVFISPSFVGRLSMVSDSPKVGQYRRFETLAHQLTGVQVSYANFFAGVSRDRCAFTAVAVAVRSSVICIAQTDGCMMLVNVSGLSKAVADNSDPRAAVLRELGSSDDALVSSMQVLADSLSICVTRQSADRAVEVWGWVSGICSQRIALRDRMFQPVPCSTLAVVDPDENNSSPGKAEATDARTHPGGDEKGRLAGHDRLLTLRRVAMDRSGITATLFDAHAGALLRIEAPRAQQRRR